MNIIDQIRGGELDEVDLLEHVTDNDVNIAIAVAESKMATFPILDVAAHDKEKRVRLAAVNNPNIGEETLKYLLYDNDDEIVAIAKNRLERS